MKHRALAGKALAVFVLGLAAARPAAPGTDDRPRPGTGAGAEVGVVERVVDGDTLVVALGGKSERVRLLGIDAPELPRDGGPGEYLAAEAAELARSLALGTTVTLQADPLREDRDGYGRLLRYVSLADGRSLNAELLRRGCAHVFGRYRFAREEEFLALEGAARDGAVGLWKEGGRAEIEWNLARGVTPVRLHPTTGRSWAIEYDGWIRTGLRPGDLPRELGKLRGAVARRTREKLAAWLREAGYVKVREAAR